MNELQERLELLEKNYKATITEMELIIKELCQDIENLRKENDQRAKFQHNIIQMCINSANVDNMNEFSQELKKLFENMKSENS